MFKIAYRVTVRIGFNDFHKEFENESAALECFNSLAADPNVEIEGNVCSLESNATVAEVTIRRFTVPIAIGNPNR